MIKTGFETRVKVQQIIENQLPNFLLSESPKLVDFLKQYYTSQEYQSGPADLTNNLDQYLKLDNLTPEVISGSYTLSSDIDSETTTVEVNTTKGFPVEYGLFQVDDEIFTYTGITTNTFTGCVRGFSGITQYRHDLNREELVFNESEAASHTAGASLKNLSVEFLNQFYNKLKYTFTPGLEGIDFVSDLNVNNFIKEARSFYQSKGTEESFKILFKVIYGVDSKVINLEDYLLKPSYANYARRKIVLAEQISGDITKITGQTLYKTSDTSTNAPISSVESFNSNGRIYHKISFYVGNDDRSSIQGIFDITPSTRITERVLVGGDVISVDSTVSFPDSGTILSGNNTITYTSKSINQFFGCSGITEELNATDFIRTNDTYFSYENGDTSKKVEVILFGVISDLEQKNNGKGVYEGDIVTIKNFGDKILNSSNNYKEIFANSWIYNTSTRYQIIDNSNLKLGSTIDRSSLKVGDNVEILLSGSEVVVSDSTVYVSEVNTTFNTISLSGGNTGINDADYDIRRKLNKASSSGPSFEYGNDTVLSDVLNLYVDGEEYAYVASNSVPSKLSSLNEYRLDIDESIKTESISSLLSFSDYDGDGYNQITLPTAVPFITGDRILYTADDESISGLESGRSYYVKVTGAQSFKLYASETLIEVDGNIKINPPDPVGNHTFTLYSQRDLILGSQKLLRKIPLQKNIKKGSNEKTIPGPVGMLINGVEINNYKSKDSIYYGPLDSVNVVFGGENYDVINLPEIEVGIGSAKIQPVVSGTLKNVFVDSQNYDIDKIVSINISGGNGSGAVIEPVISKRSRSILFSADAFSNGGGISTTSNQIFFIEEHNLTNGEEIVYNPFGSSALADLNSGSSYFTQVDNNNTITLYNSLSDQQTKTNPVTLNSTSFGIQKFETAKRKNQVSYIQVLDGGSGYTNRKLVVKPSGISSERNLVSFNNHGFESGELVNYDYQSSSISGLSTDNQYYILKVDDNSFRLCDAGIGATITQNYDRGEFVDIQSSGTGYQYFSYPDISVSITYNPVGFGTITQIYQELVTTPVVKGSIIDAYLYEGGSGYGSTIINVEKNTIISIKNGKDATLSPVILNGTISSVLIDYGGTEYSSIPDLIVTDSSGSGTGAQLRAIISNGTISSVEVVNPGIGYSSIDTSIEVVASGKNAILNSKVRKLTVNDSYDRFSSGKVLLVGNDKLQYSVSKYFEDLRDSFLESSGSRSKIIGWAYDGNPIYGPYVDTDTGVTRLSSGYVIDISQIVDRPVGFASGYFVEDYIYNNVGDLDEHNGRYENNVEFPNGIYAYHATIDASGNPEFPYFIGNTYNSKRVFENIDQSFNFNESGLLRNTLPYKVSEESAGYDFIDEIDDSISQKIEIESVSSGSIDSIEIINSGDGYEVGDTLSFNEEETSGQGLNAIVSSVKGKEVSEITTSSTQYLNSIFTWDNANQVRVSILPQHPLNSGDYVNISGFSTNLSKINGFYRIQVPSYTDGRCLSSITSATAGFTTEIYVAPIPEEISIGSSIGIGTETLKILGIFRNEDIIRIERGATGVSHTVGTAVSFLPDSFTISKNVDNFESSVNNKVFFNPRESVGVSTISGVGYSTSFTFGNIDIVEDIPARSIRIENHPFTTNQRISYTSAGSDITVSSDGVNTFSLNSLSNIFVINKQPNLIGLKTATNGNELFFHSNGSDDDQYLFETNYTQIFGDVEENEITVSISTSHGLQVGDTVKLNVKPNLSVGIGTSTAVRVLYKSEIDAIVINPIGFNSTGVSTTTNEITITDHGLVTGDKVFYEDASNSNVDKKSYYVFKINDNIFNLCGTYFDTQQDPPSVVSFASTGGSTQTLSLINPEINPTRNNNLVFDLTDSSLSGYELKIFCENTFENEFVSTGSTNSFTISGVGTVGVSTNASLTLEYNSDIPQDLYYILEQNGEQIGYDETVINYSKVEYQNSKYNNSYNIDAVTDTTFTINSRQKPERLSYASSETDGLEYSTTSSNAEGAVNSISILDTGFGYKKLPSLKSVDTTNGKNLIITTQSSSLGADKDIRVINNTYTYSSDKTLSPTASLPYFVGLTNSGTIESIDVVFGGNGYTSAPEIVLVNIDTREVIDSGILQANIQSQSIGSVDIVDSPKGIPDDSVDLFTVNNTNGISIVSIETSNSGIYTCSLLVPFGGFTQPPFSNGDKVFVENIVRGDTDGSGFNSDEYGYKFLDVSLFDSGTGKVTIDVSGLTTNTGIAATIQNLSGTIINQSDYPSLIANELSSQSKFLPNESIKVNGNTTDLIVLESDVNYLRLSGSYNLQENDRITGNVSSSAGNVNSLELNTSSFKIEYGNDKNVGWLNDIGKLSIDTQVTPDNDYYQNLSYSVKSPITYKEQKSAVENLVHSSGLKNFADTELLTASAVGFGSDSSTSIIYDLLEENRVDTINNFDNAVDIDVNSPSRFIKLENKRLSDYIELRGLNALKIDNIEKLFSNFESENTLFLDIEEVDDLKYQKYLIRVTDSNSTEIQLTDITVLSNGLDSFIVENESISNVGSGEIHENGEQYGSFVLDTNEFDENFLRFVPVDPFNTDYDLKIIRQVFNPTVSGSGTTSIGFIDLIGSKNVESTGIGSTSIVEVNSTDFNTLYVVAQVIDKVTNDMDYVKIYVRHDGTNTYQTEYYIDTDFALLSGYNENQIGTFTANLDGSTLSINHDNNTGNEIEIFTNIIGFGNTSVGVGTFRYILDGQIQGNERSAIYESNYYTTSAASPVTIQTLDKTIFDSSKCVIEVSAGSTKALHQVIMVADDNDVYTQQAPFLSVSDTTSNEYDDAAGIGTFGGSISGSDILITFYPDATQTGQIDIEIFSKSLYKTIDIINEPDDLSYGAVTESIDEKLYNSINGERINKFNFGLFNNNTPIFSKTFNPNSSALTANTGIFTIANHFFQTGEELIYTPKSTFIGVSTSPLQTSTGDLPSTVYAIKLSENTFKVATSLSDAQSGIGKTFTSLGSGNAHQFTMAVRNSKTIITLDDLVQYPIAATKITHTLDGNVGAAISETTEIISLSGISTINPTDILRIDDEYMNVVNVGLGTTNLGPITNLGTETLVKVDRGFVGSTASTHTDSTLVRVYKGAFNIVDNEIYFTQPPRGNPQINKTDQNLDFETSEFTGRVFLRSDYSTNQIYDDISDEFSGIGRTFTLRVGGANTVGLGSTGGSGLVFINSFYQSPQTENNPNRFNYTINEDTVAGITTLTFSAITVPDSNPLEYITSDYDINLNGVPRGGIIISYGSTSGLGYAPLVGASVTATVSAGAITAIGIGTTGSFGSGYNGLTAIGVSVYESGHTGGVADISATIGIGGTLAFTINDGGSGYTNPQIFVSDPSYENLPIIGVSRLGIGATTETGNGLLLDVEVGSATGIGSTLFEVKDFKFARPGYQFQRGDVFKPVGLVTDASLASPLQDFEITVIDTFSDSFAAWEFGKLDYIDSIANLQDGERVRFPLNYNAELLSFEAESGRPVSQNLSNMLLIFSNGILQDPDVNYTFGGGSSFVFTTPPKPEDDIQIYFYRGSDEDTSLVSIINQSLKVGDTVQMLKNNYIPETIEQKERLVYNLSFSDKFQTNLYDDVGVDENNLKPLRWTKQKRGLFVNGQYIEKVRDSIEALVFPTARIIKDFNSTDNTLFLDNVEIFEYEDNNAYGEPSTPFNALVVNGISTEASGSVEFMEGFDQIVGSSGIVTGISTSQGIGTPLGLTFDIYDFSEELSDLQVGYPIYIYDTMIGSGVTSIDDSDSAVVGVGTTFLDNVYYIAAITESGPIGVITCNVKSDSDIIGLSTVGVTSSPVGKFSWGRISNTSGLTRANPISIGVSGNIVSGLSTYPTIQRRGGVNLRSTGALPKIES